MAENWTPEQRPVWANSPGLFLSLGANPDKGKSAAAQQRGRLVPAFGHDYPSKRDGCSFSNRETVTRLADAASAAACKFRC